MSFEERFMNKREHLILDEFRESNFKLQKELIPIRVALASCAYNKNALGNIGESYGIWKLISEFYSIDFLPESIKIKYGFSKLTVIKWKKIRTRDSTTKKIECRLFRHLSLRGFEVVIDNEYFHTDFYEAIIYILAPENPTEIIFDDIHDPEDENDITHCKVCHDRLEYSEISYGYDMCRRHLRGRKCSVCCKYDQNTNWEKTRFVPNKNFKCHECYWKSKQKIYQKPPSEISGVVQKTKKDKKWLEEGEKQPVTKLSQIIVEQKSLSKPANGVWNGENSKIMYTKQKQTFSKPLLTPKSPWNGVNPKITNPASKSTWDGFNPQIKWKFKV